MSRMPSLRDAREVSRRPAGLGVRDVAGCVAIATLALCVFSAYLVDDFRSPVLQPWWLTPLLVVLVALFRIFCVPLNPGGRVQVALGEAYILAILLWRGPPAALLIAALGEALGHFLAALRRRYLDQPQREILLPDEILLSLYAGAEAMLVWGAVGWGARLLHLESTPPAELLEGGLWMTAILLLTLGCASRLVKALFQVLRGGSAAGFLPGRGLALSLLVRSLWIPLCVFLAVQLCEGDRFGEFYWLTAMALAVDLLIYRSYRQGIARLEKVRMLELLQHGAAAVHRSSRLDHLLESFAEDACRLVPSLSLAVAFLSDDTEEVHYVFVHRDGEGSSREALVRPSTWVRAIAALREPRLIGDTLVDPEPLRCDPLLATSPWTPRSVLGVPLAVHETPIGAVTFWSRRCFAFSAEIASTLMSLADFMATAIRRLRLIEKLRRAEARYRSLFEYAGDGIVLLEDGGAILDGNPRARSILGETARTGVDFADLFVLDDREEVRRLLARSAGQPVMREGFHRRRSDGEISDLGLSAVTLSLDGQKRYLIHVRDRSEAARLQRQLVRSQRMEVVGNLASGIAHDINNLLGVILAHSMLINERFGDQLAESDSLKAIRCSAMKGAEMARRLLRYARGAEPVRAPISIGDLLRGAIELLRNSLPAGIALECSLQVDDVLVLVDASQIQQVLLNMALNARDAMPGGGELRIGAAALQRDPSIEARENAGCEGEYVAITLSDTGTGIEPPHLEDIFEPFFTTKDIDHGTGLGLFVCRSIIRAHHGEIEVESRVGQGTTFRILLPTPSATLIPKLRQFSAAQHFAKLILFEADPATGDRLEEILRAQGYELVRIHTLEALASRDAGLRSRPVIVDLHFGGIEQAREMVEEFPAERFIWIVDDPARMEQLPNGLPVGRDWLEDQIEVQVLLRALHVRHSAV